MYQISVIVEVEEEDGSLGNVERLVLGYRSNEEIALLYANACADVIRPDDRRCECGQPIGYC